MKRLEARIVGHVQGVNFRYYTSQQARRLNLAGWVRNEPDGTVRVVAEGPEEALKSLLDFLHRGPPAARVDRVEAEWPEATGQFAVFRTTYAR